MVYNYYNIIVIMMMLNFNRKMEFHSSRYLFLIEVIKYVISSHRKQREYRLDTTWSGDGPVV